MLLLRNFRAGLAVLLSAVLGSLPAHALVSIEDGKDKLFINSSLTASYDSNLFDNATGGGDDFYSFSLSAEFARHAGLIAMNASVALSASWYGKYTDQNFKNPSFRAEFTKQTGRTTGALVLSAARESQADTAANLRDTSWNYNAALNFKYPVIERYAITGTLGYSLEDFVNNPLLVNIASYTAGADIFYVYSTDRDLLAGYNFREDRTSAGTTTLDHSFTAGLSGRLFWRLQGTLRFGYELYFPDRNSSTSYGSWTANASTQWNFTKRLNLTAQLTRSVSVTSTNVSVDTTAASASLQYAFSAKTTFIAATGFSISDFLGDPGDGRHDTNWNWSLTLNRTISGNVKASISYAFNENWSTNSFADYIARSVNLTLSSRF